ncbi:hypothetical protein BDZ91DRAFT_95811 [Kalaharituber pfeilii]|nr:hypothetical protein BDZ91DRAFT_95811 [Kalaharituber pfeilii]
MFKIILKLKRRGLPQHPDDHYFKTELDGLITEIRQWAIAFTWGQQPLTVESWDRIHAGMQEQTKQHLQSSFGENLDLLLVSPKAGSRLRTRCVEVILFRTLLKSFLSEPYIGFEAEDHSAYQRLLHVISSNGKNENVRLWSALTAHLLSKNTQDLQARQEERIDFITDTMLCNEMAALGDFGRGKKEALRVLVGKAAKLGLDMAQLPFYIRADDNLKPGAPFNEFEMVNVELEEEEEFQSMMTSIIVTPAWLKITFDDEGRERFNPYDPACYVTKARVSCFHCPRVRRST